MAWEREEVAFICVEPTARLANVAALGTNARTVCVRPRTVALKQRTIVYVHVYVCLYVHVYVAGCVCLSLDVRMIIVIAVFVKMRSCLRVGMFLSVCLFIYIYICACMCVNACGCSHVCANMWVYVGVCGCMCVCECGCVCACVQPKRVATGGATSADDFLPEITSEHMGFPTKGRGGRCQASLRARGAGLWALTRRTRRSWRRQPRATAPRQRSRKRSSCSSSPTGRTVVCARSLVVSSDAVGMGPSGWGGYFLPTLPGRKIIPRRRVQLLWGNSKQNIRR